MIIFQIIYFIIYCFIFLMQKTEVEIPQLSSAVPFYELMRLKAIVHVLQMT